MRALQRPTTFARTAKSCERRTDRYSQRADSHDVFQLPYPERGNPLQMRLTDSMTTHRTTREPRMTLSAMYPANASLVPPA